MTLLFCIILCSIIIVSIGRRKVNGTVMTKPQLNKEETLTFKGLMILFVLVGHACNFILRGCMSSWLINNLASFGLYAVSMFLFMSGYGLMYSLEKKGLEYLNDFLRKRLTKVMIPLILTTILFLPVNIIIQHQTCQEILNAFLRGVPSLRFSWFAYMIVVAYLIFYFCARWLGYCLKLVVGVSVGLLLYAMVLRVMGWKEHWYASSLSIPFGMLICYYRDKIAVFFQSRYMLCILSSIAAISITYASGVVGFAYWTISITIPFCFYLYRYFWMYMNIGLIHFLGKYSYEIYLCHGVFITLCAKFINKVTTLEFSLLAFVSILLLLLISVALQWFCGKIVKT